MKFKSKEIMYRHAAHGFRGWYKNESFHRNYFPTFVSTFGDKFWWKNGKEIKAEYNGNLSRQKPLGIK
jgi:hypothetical protein